MGSWNIDLLDENTAWTPSEDAKKRIWSKDMNEVSKENMVEDSEYIIF